MRQFLLIWLKERMECWNEREADFWESEELITVVLSKVGSSAMKFWYFRDNFHEAFYHCLTKLQINAEMKRIISATLLSVLLYFRFSRSESPVVYTVCRYILLHVALVNSHTEHLTSALLPLKFYFISWYVCSNSNEILNHRINRPYHGFGSRHLDN